MCDPGRLGWPVQEFGGKLTRLLRRATAWLPDWVVARGMRDYNENPPLPAAKK